MINNNFDYIQKYILHKKQEMAAIFVQYVEMVAEKMVLALN